MPKISYNEFITQVRAGNVDVVHATGDTIDGKLRSAATVPDDSDSKAGQQYTQFTTERPTWAQDHPRHDAHPQRALGLLGPAVGQTLGVPGLGGVEWRGPGGGLAAPLLGRVGVTRGILSGQAILPRTPGALG